MSEEETEYSPSTTTFSGQHRHEDGNDNDEYNDHSISHENTHKEKCDDVDDDDNYHQHHSKAIMIPTTMTPSTAASSSSSSLSTFMNSFQWPPSFANSSSTSADSRGTPIKQRSTTLGRTTEPLSPPSRLRTTTANAAATTPIKAQSPSSLRWATEASTTETISHSIGDGDSTNRRSGRNRFSNQRQRQRGGSGSGNDTSTYAVSKRQQQLRPSPLQSLLETTTSSSGPSSTQSAPPGISSLMTFVTNPPTTTTTTTSSTSTTGRRSRAFSSSTSSSTPPNSNSFVDFDGFNNNNDPRGGGEMTPLVQKFQYLEHNASTRHHQSGLGRGGGIGGGGVGHIFPFQLPYGNNHQNSNDDAAEGWDPPTSNSSSMVATMIQRNESSSSSSYRNYSTTSTMCGFGVAWIFWVTIWIVVLAEIMRVHNHHHYDPEEDNGIEALLSDPATMKPWTRLDRIYFATSMFWSVGGVASTGTAGTVGGCVTGSTLSPDQSTLLLPHSNTERWAICGFLLLSLGFWSLALGQWGNAVIEAHNAASMAQVQAQEQLRRDEERRKYHKEQRRRKLRYQSQRQGQRPSGITLALMQSERELAAQTNPTRAAVAAGNDRIVSSNVQHYGGLQDQFDVEDEADTSMLDNESSIQSSSTSTEFQMFPGLPWLLVQSIFCTALMIFWVVGIQYYEQRGGEADDVNPVTQEALINRIASATGHPPSEVAATLTTASDNAWDAVSTIYYAITTAYTVGLGDVTPSTRNGKILGVFFIPLSVGTAIHWVVWMAQCFLQRTQRNKVSRRDVKLRLDEFYESRLVSMGLVDDATFSSLKKEYEMMPAS